MKTFVPVKRSVNSIFLIVMCLLLNVATKAQTYTTIANGAWSSASTWQGGNIPNANNITLTTVIKIKHVITYTGSDINNSGTINIDNNGGISPRLILPAGITITNNLTGKIYVTNAELRQYRFVGGGESGTAQTGDFKNIGGYVQITNSFVEIARDWSNETAGVVVFRNSSLAVGRKYDLKATAIDTLEYTSVSMGIQGSGDFTVSGLSAYYKSLRVQVASTSGKFNLKAGIINGSIEYIMMKNHVTNVYSDDKIVANLSMITTGLTLDAYCIGNPSNYQPNGKISGAQNANASLNYFPAGLYWALRQHRLTIQRRRY